jgi:hypothetical protein
MQLTKLQVAGFLACQLSAPLRTQTVAVDGNDSDLVLRVYMRYNHANLVLINFVIFVFINFFKLLVMPSIP